MSYSVDNDNNDTGSVHSKWNDRLRNIRISRIYIFRLHHKFVIDRTKKINKIVDKDKTNKSIDKDSNYTYVNNNISDEIPDDRKELVLSALDKINHLSNEKDDSVKKVGIDSDKEISKESTVDIHKSDIGEIPSDREEFVLGVLNDVRKSAPEREVSVKRVGIDSDKEISKESTVYIHKSDIGEIPSDRKEFVLGVLNDVRKSAPEREVSVKRVGINQNDDVKSCLDKLDDKILCDIREGFEDQLDELEILEGELYSRDLGEDSSVVKNEIDVAKEKVQVFIDKIDKLFESKKNKYENVDDDDIDDCLYDYKMLLDSFSNYDSFDKEYQKLDEYYSMYNDLKSIRANVMKIQDSVNMITDKVDIDIGIQKRLLDFNKVNISCVDQMNRQNDYLDGLMKKINIVNSEEYVTTHMRGFGDLVKASFKYLCLLMLNPFKGTIPGIGIQTLATKKLVGNLYHNLHWEKEKLIHYSAVNYDYEINDKIRDIDYVDSLLNDTFKDIGRLKGDFKARFDSSFPSFNSVLDKINKLEHTIIRNQSKVKKIRNRLSQSKKINSEKLMRVRKLNEH